MRDEPQARRDEPLFDDAIKREVNRFSRLAGEVMILAGLVARSSAICRTGGGPRRPNAARAL